MSDDEQPAELVGATEKPVTLAGATTATSIAVSAPAGPAAAHRGEPRRAAERRTSTSRTSRASEPGPAVRRLRQPARGRAAGSRRPALRGRDVVLRDREPTGGRRRPGGGAPHGLRHVFDITLARRGADASGALGSRAAARHVLADRRSRRRSRASWRAAGADRPRQPLRAVDAWRRSRSASAARRPRVAAAGVAVGRARRRGVGGPDRERRRAWPRARAEPWRRGRSWSSR